MARAAALALVLFTLAAGDARAAQEFHVYTANLPIADYSNGAIGLLVPGAGPNTSNEQALRALRSGKAVNSLRGGSPGGPPLIEVTRTAVNGSSTSTLIHNITRPSARPEPRPSGRTPCGVPPPQPPAPRRVGVTTPDDTGTTTPVVVVTRLRWRLGSW